MQRRNIVKIDDIFGKLTVIGISNNRLHNGLTFVCKCECGTIKDIRKCALTNGSTISCGCHTRSLTKVGDTFGLLKVLGQDKTKHKGRTRWICECECGTKIPVSGNALQTGNTRSCGCTNSREYKDKKYFNTSHGIITITGRYKQTRFYTYLCNCGKTGKVTEAGIKTIEHCGCLYQKPELTIEPESIKNLTRGIYNRIKRSGDLRNLPFNVTQKCLWDLYIKQDKRCSLSGESILISPNRIKNTASLDRIDSSKGYEASNIQWVHREINMIKGKWEQTIFLNWVEKISKFKNLKDKENVS